jgi:hypothetical protein
MAKSVNVSWVLPTTRESGLPLNLADVAAVELSLSTDGTTFAVYDSFVPAVLATVIPELEIGEWWVSGVVVDTAGKRSKPAVKSIVVPDESAPAALTLTLAF